MSEAVASSDEQLAVGRVVLDRAALLVTVQGNRFRLAMQEFRLLELLMAHADHVLPTALILERVWGPTFSGDPGTVAVHVLRLRKKLERSPGSKRHLRTVRGIGYVFDTEPVASD
jgi:two-component system, OmpR family, response regulator RegX3